VPVVITFLLTPGLGSDRDNAGQREPIDVPGAVLAALGLAGTVFALIEQQRLGMSHPTVVGALAGGLLCLAAFVWWQFRSAHPMVPMNLFAIRNFGIGNLATAFVYAAVSMGTLMISLYLQEVAGFSATKAGLATLPLPVLSFFLARPVGALAARFGPHMFMAVGPVLAGIGFFLMRPAEGSFNFWVQLLPGLVLFGLGLVITVTPLTSAVLSAVDPGHSGIASAINNAVARLAGLIAVAFIGVIAAGPVSHSSFLRVATVTGVLLLLGGVVSAVGIRNPANRLEPVRPEIAASCQDRATAPPRLITAAPPES
jgi:predicted MFS family arabinose efflux permease